MNQQKILSQQKCADSQKWADSAKLCDTLWPDADRMWTLTGIWFLSRGSGAHFDCCRFNAVLISGRIRLFIAYELRPSLMHELWLHCKCARCNFPTARRQSTTVPCTQPLWPLCSKLERCELMSMLSILLCVNILVSCMFSLAWCLTFNKRIKLTLVYLLLFYFVV